MSIFSEYSNDLRELSHSTKTRTRIFNMAFNARSDRPGHLRSPCRGHRMIKFAKNLKPDIYNAFVSTCQKLERPSLAPSATTTSTLPLLRRQPPVVLSCESIMQRLNPLRFLPLTQSICWGDLEECRCGLDQPLRLDCCRNVSCNKSS
jgi:hypothetical protein